LEEGDSSGMILAIFQILKIYLGLTLRIYLEEDLANLFLTYLVEGEDKDHKGGQIYGQI